MEKKPSLYAISERMNNIIALLDDETLPPEALAGAMAEIEAELEEKGAGCIVVLKRYEERLNAVKAELKRMKEYEAYLKRHQDGLKGAIIGALDRMGRKDIETDLGRISWSYNPPAMVVENEAAVPAEFLTVIPAQVIPAHTEVNKEALKKALKAADDGALYDSNGAPIAFLTRGRKLVIK